MAGTVITNTMEDLRVHITDAAINHLLETLSVGLYSLTLHICSDISEQYVNTVGLNYLAGGLPVLNNISVGSLGFRLCLLMTANLPLSISGRYFPLPNYHS